MKPRSYDLRPCSMSDVRALCAAHHGYGGASNTATYAFGVFEAGRIVAAYAWQPPPPGAAKSVCPEAPQAVLSLSRMVAVPRTDRILNHVSKPLRAIMRLIDRGRWPVLVTYSDEGQGHTGHVYKCSGWTATRRSKTPTLTAPDGSRVSSYVAGKHRGRAGLVAGSTVVQRWEHWACDRGGASSHMQGAGWVRVPTGGTYRNGAPAHTYVRREVQP